MPETLPAGGTPTASKDEHVELPAWLGAWREAPGDPVHLSANLARPGIDVPA